MTLLALGSANLFIVIVYANKTNLYMCRLLSINYSILYMNCQTASHHYAHYGKTVLLGWHLPYPKFILSLTCWCPFLISWEILQVPSCSKHICQTHNEYAELLHQPLVLLYLGYFHETRINLEISLSCQSFMSIKFHSLVW